MEPLTAVRLRAALGYRHRGVTLCVLPTVDSTNLRLKQRAREGTVRPPYLLLAGEQTNGRGRLGRSFVSPPGTGLYMSLLLQPPADMPAGRITLLAAVAVCRAIEGMTPLRPKIKWVNDIFVKGKKVCGILAEAVEKQVVVGVGINLRTPPGGFPPEAAVAGALDAEVSRTALAGRVAAYLLDEVADWADPGILEQYRARMPLTGREVRYTQNGLERAARVLGVAEDGGLIVEGDGGREILRCGEVSLGSQAFLGLE